MDNMHIPRRKKRPKMKAQTRRRHDMTKNYGMRLIKAL
jgi:hypothetical protein